MSMKKWILRLFSWSFLRRKLHIAISALLIVSFVISPIGPSKPKPANAAVVTTSALAAHFVLGCGTGMATSAITWSIKHGGILKDARDPAFVVEMGIGCTVGALWGPLKITLFKGFIQSIVAETLGIGMAEVATFTYRQLAEGFFEARIEPYWPSIYDHWRSFCLLMNPVSAPVFIVIESIKLWAGQSSDLYELMYELALAYVNTTGQQAELDTRSRAIGNRIVEPDGGILFNREPVQAIVMYEDKVQACPDTDNGIGTDINFVEFGYSLTGSETDIVPLPNNESIEAKDYYGCNGWGFEFDMKKAGFDVPTPLYLAVRAEDLYGNRSNWEFSNLIIAEPLFPHDYSVSMINVNPPSSNVGETISIQAVVKNDGIGREENVRIDLNRDGNFLQSHYISPLEAGVSTTTTFNVTSEEGAHTYTIISKLSSDQDRTNDSASLTIVPKDIPYVLINGSSLPSAQRITTTTQGSTGSFNVIVQNIGSAPSNVTVSKDGAYENWITLGTDPGTMAPHSTKNYTFSVDVPSGQPVGMVHAEINFNWASGGVITLPIDFDIVNTGNGFEIKSLSPSSGIVDGNLESTLTLDQVSNVVLDNYTSTIDIDIRLSDSFYLENQQYYRIKSDTANEWYVNVTEHESEKIDTGMYFRVNTLSTTKTDSFSGTFSIYDSLKVGENTWTVSLSNLLAQGNNTRWTINQSKFMLDLIRSAWNGNLTVSSEELSQWSAGWDSGRVCAYINNVSRAGDVTLYNNGEPIRTRAIDSSYVGEDVCWNVSEVDFKLSNNFNLKTTLNGAQVNLSNIRWEINYLSGQPALQATRELSALKANVNENVVATLNFENIGTNFAYDPTFSDTLPSGLQLISGSTSGEAPDVDPALTQAVSYSFTCEAPGTYVIPGSLVQYFDPSNYTYITVTNNSVVEFWGGTLAPVLEEPLPGTAGTPIQLTATLTDTLLSNPVGNAQVIAEITRPDDSIIQIALLWQPATEKYVGTYIPTQAGSYQVSLYASKAYYLSGVIDPLDWVVEMPNQPPVANTGFATVQEGATLEVSLDASNTLDVDGVLTSYSWDIDDNGIEDANGRIVTWTFPHEGDYPVRLTVTDHDGATDTILSTVYVGTLAVNTSLSTGWNLISLPIEPVDSMTAEAMCQAIGADAAEIDRWASGGWDSHVCGLSFNDFAIELGEGYFVKLATADSWELSGRAVTSSLSICLTSGWNLISLPQGFSYTASQLAAAISSQGGQCSEIDRWMAGGWDSFIIGLPFNDFAIEPGTGYFVKCSNSSTYVYDP